MNTKILLLTLIFCILFLFPVNAKYHVDLYPTFETHQLSLTDKMIEFQVNAKGGELINPYIEFEDSDFDLADIDYNWYTEDVHPVIHQVEQYGTCNRTENGTIFYFKCFKGLKNVTRLEKYWKEINFTDVYYKEKFKSWRKGNKTRRYGKYKRRHNRYEKYKKKAKAFQLRHGLNKFRVYVHHPFVPRGQGVGSTAKMKLILVDDFNKEYERYDWTHSSWWNESYSYSQNITITTSTPGKDKQVRLLLNSSNVGANFDWTNDETSIRFINSSNESQYYWVEEWNTAQQNATIWVNVTNLEATTILTMYYGATGATNVSNAEKVFPKVRYDANIIVASHFDEGSGTIGHDDSANNHNANFLGTSPQWISNGKYGSAINLQNAEYMDYGDNDDYNITDQLTLMLWANFNSLPAVDDCASLLAKRTETTSKINYQLAVCIRSTAEDGWRWISNGLYGSNDISSGEGLVPGTNRWYQLLATINGTNWLKIYEDGILNTSKTASVAQLYPPLEQANLTIGRSGSRSGEYIDAKIDEFIFLGQASSADQVSDFYNYRWHVSHLRDNIYFYNYVDTTINYGVEETSIINSAPDVPTINNPLDNSNTSNTTLTFSCTVGDPETDNMNITFWHSTDASTYSSFYTINEQTNGTYTYLNSSIDEGVQYFKCEACDNRSACTNSSVITYTVDRTGPIVTINSPINTNYTNPTINLNYDQSDALLEVDECRYELNGASNVTLSTKQNTTFTAIEGINTIKVFCNDTLNNIGSDTQNFYLDTTMAPATISSPTNTTYSDSNVILSFSLSESPDFCSYELNGVNSTIPNCNQSSNSILLVGLVENGNQVKVYANDTNGIMNVSSIVYFSIDTTFGPITISSPANATYNGANVLLQFSYSETPSQCVYELDDVNTTVTGCNKTDNMVNLILSHGGHHVKVYGTDAYSNQNVSSMVYFSVNLSAPIISNVAVGSITSSSATITWTTDIASNSSVSYGTNQSSLILTSDSATLTTSHSIQLTGLSASTTYYYVVNSTGSNGKSSNSSIGSFTTSQQTSSGGGGGGGGSSKDDVETNDDTTPVVTPDVEGDPEDNNLIASIVIIVIVFVVFYEFLGGKNRYRSITRR